MRQRCPSSSRPLLETLEPRVLLSGVTLITHGAQFLGISNIDWIDSMASALRTRTGPSTAIYSLRMEPGPDGTIVADTFKRIAGPAPASDDSSNGQTVLLLDWSQAAGVNILTGRSEYATTRIATAVIPYLLNAYPDIGLAAPLAEGAIQLIGHSRGASMVSEIARLLGTRGVWVDHLTLLDPAPVSPDPAISLRANVLFADNYYQTDAMTRGMRITGAYNAGPLDLGGAYGLLDGDEHGDVHLFYHGTINLAANASDGAQTVRDNWYPDSNLSRDATGFFYSHLVGGERPVSGIGAAFGGTASRTSLTRSGVQWANIGLLKPSATTLNGGASFTVDYRYASHGTPASVVWYLDADTNPYNDNAVALTAATGLKASGDSVIKATAQLRASVTPGTWYLVARISNADAGGGTRFAYSSPLNIINAPPIGWVDVPGAILRGWAIDPDVPGTSVTLRLDVDGATFATATANLPRPDLVAVFGSAPHGFSFDLTSLNAGIHRIDLFAHDTTTDTPTLVASRTVTTNRPPVGSIDLFNGTVLAGWALDHDASGDSIRIRYQIDSHAPCLALASVTRHDLTPHFGSSDHGFHIRLPQLIAGAHSVTVHAIDADTGELILLGTRFANVAHPPDNLWSTGWLDVASPTRLAGWVYDPSLPGTPALARIDIDGTPGVPFPADALRPDLTPHLGDPAHGFFQDIALPPGQHRIDLFAIDDSGVPVLIASRIVGGLASSPPATVLGSLDVVTANRIAGWLWSAATPQTPATYRIDIDGLAGTPAGASVNRTDVNNALSISGTHGYVFMPPRLAAGTHSVTLHYLDPLTFALKALATATLVTV